MDILNINKAIPIKVPNKIEVNEIINVDFKPWRIKIYLSSSIKVLWKLLEILAKISNKYFYWLLK